MSSVACAAGNFRKDISGRLGARFHWTWCFHQGEQHGAGVRTAHHGAQPRTPDGPGTHGEPQVVQVSKVTPKAEQIWDVSRRIKPVATAG